MLHQVFMEVFVRCSAELKNKYYSRSVLWSILLAYKIQTNASHALSICLKAVVKRLEAVNSLFLSSMSRLISSH